MRPVKNGFAAALNLFRIKYCRPKYFKSINESNLWECEKSFNRRLRTISLVMQSSRYLFFQLDFNRQSGYKKKRYGKGDVFRIGKDSLNYQSRERRLA
jgi:hypothetical protein